MELLRPIIKVTEGFVVHCSQGSPWLRGAEASELVLLLCPRDQI